MVPELLHRVHASVGDLRPVQPCNDLFNGELTEHGVDSGMQRLAVGHPLCVAIKAWIGRHLGLFEHNSAELRPLALILQAKVDLLAIASTEGAIGRDGGVTRASARWWGATICRI